MTVIELIAELLSFDLDMEVLQEDDSNCLPVGRLQEWEFDGQRVLIIESEYK